MKQTLTKESCHCTISTVITSLKYFDCESVTSSNTEESFKSTHVNALVSRGTDGRGVQSFPDRKCHGQHLPLFPIPIHSPSCTAWPPGQWIVGLEMLLKAAWWCRRTADWPSRCVGGRVGIVRPLRPVVHRGQALFPRSCLVAPQEITSSSTSLAADADEPNVCSHSNMSLSLSLSLSFSTSPSAFSSVCWIFLSLSFPQAPYHFFLCPVNEFLENVFRSSLYLCLNVSFFPFVVPISTSLCRNLSLSSSISLSPFLCLSESLSIQACLSLYFCKNIYRSLSLIQVQNYSFSLSVGISLCL